ncbi:KAP family P-loop NTPase fold protein [Vibrio fluvialis]|uniref:KAP family P-loop NTPase fold protein n=1 Tax=Vibrio fluvialis TaxID=676 RepID=UPI0023A98F0A|nr:P-loop NTPase fold protein [Vibrio fluvialis]MDE5178234.1 P-loop NTPase fold protein [Vibrio fluvialis]
MSNIHEVPPDITFDKFPVIDRRSYSEHLTNFLNSKAESGYVLNLNAEWGAGKTTFLQCWYNELKKDHPVVYFDAWKSDFTHDAMLALLEAFHSQLMNALTENKALLKKVMEGGAHFIKSTSWKLALGFIKRQGGMDADDSLFSDISEELNELGIDASDLTDSLKETFTSMTEQKRKVEGVHDFKKTLVELSKAYLEVHSDKKGPIYVLIDELDRCRPTYAIEVIESVKHFFNTENFVFVLATDTEQLQHSIRAVYGTGFNSFSYLSRFFDQVITLEAPTLEQYLEVHLTEITCSEPPENRNYIKFLVNIFQWHGIRSLREISKILHYVEIASSQNQSYNIGVLIALSVLKSRYPEHYIRLKDRRLNPYFDRSSIGSSRTENHLSSKHEGLSFKITQELSLPFEQILFHLIYCVITNDISTNGDFSDVIYLKSNQVERSGLKHQIVMNYSSQYYTRSKSAAAKEAYFSILEFAGHINDVSS